MPRVNFLLDKEWKFAPETPELATFQQVSHADSYALAKAGGVKGPGGVHWEDGDWRVLDLPHDYFSETPIGPDNLHSHGYHARGNGWYRKTFRMEEALRGQHFLLCLEGVAVKAEVYFNGSLVQSVTGGKTLTLKAEVDGLAADEVTFSVQPVTAPRFLYAAINRVVDGWTASPIFDTAPDPLMVLVDEDMNSFAPVSLGGKDLQAGFVKGYKIYRAFLQMPATGRATLRFGRVQAAEVQLFANGQPIATSKEAQGEWKVDFAAPAGQKVELRVRLFAGGEPSGMSEGVFLEN